MREYLDTGASLAPSAPCLTMAGVTLSYAFVQELSWRIARGLDRSGVRPGDRVAVLSGNDPTAFSCVFGIARVGATWVPLDPAGIFDAAGCTCLLFHVSFAPLVERLRPHLAGVKTVICLGGASPGATPFEDWLEGVPASPWDAAPRGDLDTGTALTLLGHPAEERPRFLAPTSLTGRAGLLSRPVLALGGEIVLMPAPDVTDFLHLVERHRITHAFLPTALLCRLLDNITLDTADLTSLRCLLYGDAPLPAARLREAHERVGPVLHRPLSSTDAASRDCAPPRSA
ncbi:AMP-binding protein [Amycolatopsis sp. OK19-0408]|uniref:AMP-binding protein n=1 Tax=Amycolatopsis iheyensis TaxID=2945988 RepID=A0A9X2NBM2_9PSEU|nr:AMP-binding protein [Amycolatopsis iheyensis]MCR6485684.1 AMP-binding protein [Amycolatopsis iheyensis]